MSQRGDDQMQQNRKAEPLPYRPQSATPANQMPMMSPYMNQGYFNPNDYWNYYQYMQFVNYQQFVQQQYQQQHAQLPVQPQSSITASSSSNNNATTNGTSNLPPPVQFFDPYSYPGGGGGSSGYGLGIPFNYPTATPSITQQQQQQHQFDTQSLHSLHYETNSYMASSQRPPQTPLVPQHDLKSQIKGTQSVNSFKNEELESVKNDQEANDSDLIKKERLTPRLHQRAHVRASFGLNCLVQVRANDPCEVQPALVDIYNLNDLLEDYLNEDLNYKLVQEYPGPLCRESTPKTLVIQFCQKRMKECLSNTNIIDPQSHALLWEFLALLVRQNGNIDLKTDISPLLINEDENWTLNAKSSSQLLEQDDEVGPSIDGFNAFSINRSTARSLNDDEILSKLRQLLASGQKNDAIEWAIKYNLWSHAFFIALHLDAKILSKLKSRFINSLSENDPIQTTYQLLVGRVPSMANNLAKFEWNDWKRHLATIVSNVNDSNRDLVVNSVKTIGDSLATNGRIAASHFCYLLAKCQFGEFERKSSKLVLIGSSQNQEFSKFCQTSAIQATEIYEFAVQSTLDHLIQYKLIYALRLFDYGLLSEAYKYVKSIAIYVNQNPSANIDKLSTLFHLSNRLRSHEMDMQLNDSLSEPLWLTELTSNFKKHFFNEHMNSSQKEDVPVMTNQLIEPTLNNIQAYETQTQNFNGYVNDFNVTTNAYDLPQNNFENTYQQPNDYANQYYEKQPAGDTISTATDVKHDYISQAEVVAPTFFNPTQFQQPTVDTQSRALSTTPILNDHVYEQVPQYQSNNKEDDDLSFHNPKVVNNHQKNDDVKAVNNKEIDSVKLTKNKSKDSEQQPQQSKSIISSVLNIFSKPSGPKAMVLPDDKKKSVVWDDKLKRYVDRNKSNDTEEVAKPPPPKMNPLMTQSLPQVHGINTSNPFQRKKESYYSALQASKATGIPSIPSNNNNYNKKSESLSSILSAVPPPTPVPQTFFTPMPLQNETNTNTFHNPQQAPI